MDTNIVILILGVLVVAGVLVLLWRGQKGTRPSTLKLSLADIFKMDLSLSPQNTAQAQEDISEAEKTKPAQSSPRALPELGATSALARVLWIDDHPANNVYETLALERLGKLVTAATTSAAARIYLSRMDFAAVVTNLGRDDDPEAGTRFIQELRSAGNRIPVVVYTANASSSAAAAAKAAGADAVVDLPHLLVQDIETRVTSSRRKH
ncbi:MULTISPECIES: response regulator [Amycolatopsis]|uniref:Response regulator n=1 Tax=Amycolatopsis dendrobii TaxID=2760662 RepID=A0A7W3W2V7_9PSEU|nr:MULTISPECIES: response regulator [Amycolatopsis]MBB1157714.1 response regulator [Amycolatopsis dendrobii]UKD54102.1 response regulator [Amycolatopsis sp. FU40]